MESLPIDSVRQIGEYLCADDVVNFSCTSKCIKKQISLCSTTPRMFIRTFEKAGNDDNFHYGFDIPIPISYTTVHSVRISLKWRDQGWGNMKGGIQIHSNDGEVVYNSGIAPHRIERLFIELKVSPDKTYQLHYRAGGGGGHSLTLYESSVEFLLSGDKSHVYSNAYNFVQRTDGPTPFDSSEVGRGQIYRDVFLSSAEYIMNGGLEIPPPMKSFFTSHVKESDLTLEFVQLIKSILVDWENERSTFLNPPRNLNHAQVGIGPYETDSDDEVYGI